MHAATSSSCCHPGESPHPLSLILPHPTSLPTTYYSRVTYPASTSKENITSVYKCLYLVLPVARSIFILPLPQYVDDGSPMKSIKRLCLATKSHSYIHTFISIHHTSYIIIIHRSSLVAPVSASPPPWSFT